MHLGDVLQGVLEQCDGGIAASVVAPATRDPLPWRRPAAGGAATQRQVTVRQRALQVVRVHVRVRQLQ